MSKKNQEEIPSFLELYKKNYKKLLLLPLLLFIIALGSIAYTMGQEGVPIYRDVSLKGGLSAVLSVESELSAQAFENALLETYPNYSFRISEIFEEALKTGFIVDTDLDEEAFIESAEVILGEPLKLGENYSSNFISPTLSNTFFTQSMLIMLFSFVLMSLVVFFYFRKIVPSFAVILSVLFDIIVTVGILNVFKFEISIAGIGALLMLIGYSIDTDILLTNRLIKEHGDNYLEKAFFAFKTGVLMTGTTLIAGSAALLFTNSDVIFEIALIMIIGLLVDFISTWFQNTGILLWWLEKKG